MGTIDTFQAIFSSLPDAVIITDERGKILHANEQVQKLFGYNEEELLKGGVELLFPGPLQHGHLKEPAGDIFSKAGREEVEKGELTVCKKDGRPFSAEIKVRAIDTPDQVLTIYTIRDQSEVAIQKSEGKYRSIFENIQDLFFQTDLNGIILGVSPSVEFHSGYTPGEIVGTRVEDLYYEPLDRSKFLHQLKTQGKVLNFELRLKTKNGDLKYAAINARLVLDSKGNPLRIEGMMRDETERKKAAEEVNKSNERYRALLTNLDVGVVVHAPDTSILNSNPKASELLGLSITQMQGKTAIDPEWRFMDENKLPLALEKYPVNQILTGKKQIRNFIAGVNRPATKDVVWLIVNGFPVLDSEGQILEIVISFIDITEHKRMEVDISERKLMAVELIRAKEKAQEGEKLKTAFLQNISHEIRTPMNAIIGFSKMLEEPTLNQEARKNYTSIIVNSTNQLLSIVTDILTISALDTKQEKLSISKVSINQIIDDLLEIFRSLAAEQNILLIANQKLSDRKSEIYTDQTKVTQMLTNLISNALKFTTRGTIEFGYTLKGEYLEFFVKDNGIGIKKELQEKIFERFRQADLSINEIYGGTGLGLSISKGFAELLGGKIWVESLPGKGSTFYFTIPYKAVIEIEAPETPMKQIERDMTVLIAEDEAINFLYLKLLFEGLNFHIIHAKNGQKAVDVCKFHPEIDVVLMDIKMPIMDGYSAAKEIKQFRPTLPIIAQTGYALQSEREKYSGGAFDDFISKPIDGNTLIQKIRKLVT